MPRTKLALLDVQPTTTVEAKFARPNPETVAQIVGAERKKRKLIKFRIAQDNQLQACIAAEMFGYHSGMKQQEREKAFEMARKHIAGVAKKGLESPNENFIRAVTEGQNGFINEEATIDKELARLVTKLPVADWMVHPDRRGFGVSSLASIVGTAGDLCNFPTIDKLWRFLSLAPYTANGVTKSGSEWRKTKTKGLTTDEWIDFGYSPSRRSLTFMIGQNVTLSNCAKKEKVNPSGSVSPAVAAGPYYNFYLTKKAAIIRAHPDREGKHADLLARMITTKRYIRDLWREWIRLSNATQADLDTCFAEAMAQRAVKETEEAEEDEEAIAAA